MLENNDQEIKSNNKSTYHEPYLVNLIEISKVKKTSGT